MKRLLITLVMLSFLSATLAQTTIRIMGYAGVTDPAIVQGLIDEVIGDQLAEEGITLQFEPLDNYDVAIANALSAGTAADIFYLPSATAPGLVASGRVLPLDDLVDTSPFIDSLIETFTFDGQVYGIPKDTNNLAIHYNIDLFDEAGVEYPNEDDTWDTFADKLRGVAELDDEVYGACFPADFARFGAFAYANGWEPFDEEGNTDLLDERFVEAFEWYIGLVREGAAAVPSDLGTDWTGGCFATDQVGVAIEGTWMLPFLRDAAPNLQFGSTLMPIGPSGERGNFAFTTGWSVNRDSPNQEAALRVLELLTSEEAQQWVLEAGFALPSREALAENPYFAEGTPEAEANRVVFESATEGNVYGFQFGAVGTDWFAPINNALTAVMTGQSEVMPALEQAQQELDALIERTRR